jgi:hypothetical protein
MSFTKYEKHWEISRLASKLNTVVVGGTQKLWKKFLTDNDPDKVITYASADYFTGSVYEKLGFRFVKWTEPGFKYYNKNTLNVISRQKLQRHKLIKNGFDINMSTDEITESLGYVKLYDSGNYKYERVPTLKSRDSLSL